MSINRYHMFPTISAVNQSKNRPLWSVMIPTYNSSIYLNQTLSSVIAQDPGVEKMQIEIVDDCSKGNPSLETLKILKFTDRVGFYRQSENVGLSRNWNTCIQRANGEIVHILHQDDMVMPLFYAEMEKAFSRNFDIGAAFCRHQIIDEKDNILDTPCFVQNEPGIITDWLNRLAIRQLIQTASIVVRRSVYEKLGGFHPDLAYALDWEMWLRIASEYPMWYEPQILACYRVHSQSETARLNSSGKAISDLRRFYEIRHSYLPAEVTKKSENNSRREIAYTAFGLAIIQLDHQNLHSALLLINEGFRIKADLHTIIRLCKMVIKFSYVRIKLYINHFYAKYKE